MIDTAIPDMVADGLINFDKRRKEFEVLAQVSYLDTGKVQIKFLHFSDSGMAKRINNFLMKLSLKKEIVL